MSADAEYHPLDPAVMAAPTNAYAELRDRCPVFLVEDYEPPHYVLSRHHDVEQVLLDPDVWSSRHGHGPGVSSNMTLAYCDDPEHGRQRRIVSRAFTPRSVLEIEPRIEAIAHELIDGFIADGACDLHERFATPLPIIVIAEMLGVPSDRQDDFKRWSDDSVLRLASGDPRTYPESAREFKDFFTAHIDERRAQLAAGATPPDDLVTRLVMAGEDGAGLSAPETLSIIGQLLTAGNETTTSLLLNLVLRLSEYPEVYEQLRADPSLCGAAVEESLRFDAPVLGLWRTPNDAQQLHGTTIPADHKVQVLFSSANRDEAVWDDPDTFRLDRPTVQARSHLAFGAGAHFCLGAALARAEGRIGLRALVERLPELRVTATPERIPAFFLWGWRTLPVAWSR